MKRFAVLAATAALASGIFLGAAGAGYAAGHKQAILTPAQAAQGLAAWKKAGCAQCHTLAAGGGQGTRGPNLDGLWFPVVDMVRQITNGGGYMPAFGQVLTKVQIQTLANWIDAKRVVKSPTAKKTGATTTAAKKKGTTTTKPATPVLTPAEKAIGVAAWAKAGCAQCHTLAAQGAHGTRGPDLDGLYFPVADIVRQVTNGGGYMPAFGQVLTKQQIQALANYVAAVRKVKS